MRGLFRRAVVVAGALVGMFAVAAAMVAAPGGMASASVAAHHPLRPGSHPVRSSGMTLGQAPAGLRAAVRKRLGPLAAGGGSAFQKAKLIAAGGAASDHFGWSVAVSGTTAVVGASNASSGTGAAYVFVHSGSTWLQETELTAAGGAAGDQFGYTVAISGTTVVVGAPGVSSDTGAAYVFVRSGTTWPQQAELADPGAAAHDYFGTSVAIYKSTVVVGATEGGNGGAGAAYVFTGSGSSWSEQATLTAAGGAAGDLFGASVAVSGSTMVVGAYADNADTGAAYVFTGSGSSWSQQATLTATGGTANDLFGGAVAISGSTVVVGAYGTNSGTGAAYVFVRSAKGAWSQRAELADPAAAAGDDFGDSVAISGSTAVIGAPDFTNSGAGAAYTFTRSGSTWAQRANLAADPGTAGDDFGRSVAITGSTVLAGADGSKHSTGAAYVFLPPAQQAELADPGGTADDAFGTSVAISGSTAVVGAPAGITGKTTGAAYVFVRSGTKWSQPATLPDPGGAAGDEFGTSVAIAGPTASSGPTVVVGAPGTNSYTGAAYVFVRSRIIKLGWDAHELPDPGGAAGDYFGTSVAISGSTSLTAVVGAPGVNLYTGAAYIYTGSGLTWSQEAQLSDDAGSTYDQFGASVAVAGSTVVAGAAGVAGAAFVFVGSGTAWSRQAGWTDPGGGAQDNFGTSVAISGSTVLVGAPGVNTTTGAAYVYTRSGTTWSQQAGIADPGGTNGDYFGTSVAITGSTTVVGASQFGRRGAGAAYMFTRSGSAWSQQAELTAADGAARDYFATSVAISGSTAVVGAEGNNTYTGAAYVFVNV